MLKVSIIIPAWREGGKVSRLAERFDGLDGTEVIASLVVNDGETEKPESEAVKVVRSQRGRARQMNAGAAAADGDILLFLHADTIIDPESLDNVRAALEAPGAVAGAFRLAIDHPSPWARLISSMVNIRSRWLHYPYGDQALFIKREVFDRIGGFGDAPIMEDVRLVESARKVGSIVILEDVAVTAPRRWEKRGFLRNTLRNWATMLAYKAGVDPKRLAVWYYKDRP